MTTLREKCVSGITANSDYCRRHLQASTAFATALAPLLGYERAAELAKKSLSTGATIQSLVLASGDVTEEQLRSLSGL
ncbi:hypothetical protein AB4Z25_27235 [Rhizobium sp. RAF36]|uniref:hypothetical protein n=1 Tax=Rhizobium sp. RAF36 TaxID=3233055 RepID=UPI003F96A7F4